MKKILIFLLILTSLINLPGRSVQAEESQPPFEVAAKHAIAVELSTGKILYEKDSRTVTGIASITKLLTAYLVYEAIEAEKLNLDTKVTISNYAYNLTFDSSITNVPMDARSYTVDQLLNAMLVASSNSAAIALAEEIGGTEPRFVDKMMAKLKKWGITDAKLVNASGLKNDQLGGNIYPDSTAEDENMMSAHAVALVTQRILQDFPQISKLTSKLTMTWNGQSVPSWNYLLEGAAYGREGINGMITGTSDTYGSSIVTSGQENDMEIITVILNADNSQSDNFARYTAASNLLEHISESYYLAPLIKKGQTFGKSQIKLLNGKAEYVSAVAKSDFNVVQKANAEITKASFKAEKSDYQAPVQKNTPLGTLTFQDQGYLGDPPNMVMVAQKTIERSNFIKVWWNEFVNWVNKEL